MFDAQGDDVVAGTHQTEPIAVLDERMPAVAAELRDHAERLERHYADLCDIEFTIEDGRLWMLQVRVGKRSPQAALRMAVDMAEDESFPLSRAEAVERVSSLLADPPEVATGRSGAAPPLTVGLPASPGVASGPIVTNPEAAMAAADEGRAAILVRAETSPDDVHGMARAAGILTSRGGLASHAAVVARGWGIPAVVGASGIEVRESEVVVGDRTLKAGEVVTIDGSTGEVFEGTVAGATEPMPEARTLLDVGGGARDRHRRRRAAVAEPTETAASEPSGVPRVAHEVTADDCVRALAIKGFAQAEAVADFVLSTPDGSERSWTSSSPMDWPPRSPAPTS